MHTSDMENTIERDAMLNTTIVEPIRARLDSNRGPSPAISVGSLLASIIAAAGRHGSYRAANITEALNGMTPSEARRLGIDPAELPAAAVECHTVAMRLSRLENALAEGWQSGGQTYDMDWFAAELLQASIPHRTARRIRAAAVDRTDFPTTARLRNRAGGEPSADPDAGLGYRRAAADHDEGVFIGYDIHLAVAVREIRFSGVHRAAAVGDYIAPYILGISVEPAGTNPAIGGSAAVNMARRIAAASDEIVAGIGYTNHAPEFNRPLHELGVNVAMSHMPHKTAGAEAVLFAGSHAAIEHRGTLLHPHQRIPFGTGPWAQSIARGAAAESVIGSLRRQGAFTARSCPQHGTIAHRIAALAVAVAHNLRLAQNQRTAATSPSAARRSSGTPRRKSAIRTANGLASAKPQPPAARPEGTPVPFSEDSWASGCARHQRAEAANRRLKPQPPARHEHSDPEAA